MIGKSALFVIMLFIAATAFAQEQKPRDSLVVAISTDFQPFTFLNAEGKPAGMFVDIWRLWAQKTGKQIEFISSDWNTSLENLKHRKADIHSGLIYSPERSEWIGGSQPFYESGVSLFYPLKQGRISDISELSGQPIAILRGTNQELFLRKTYPDIRGFTCDTREELVSVSREGKTRGFIAISPVGASVINRMGLSGEFEIYDKVLSREKFHAGVLKKNTELLALVDKGLDAISYQERAEIEARWIPDPIKRYYKTSNIVRLTPAEEAWLRSHKTIRVGMSPTFPPLKFQEKGVIKGIEPDYLDLLSEYTGIRFEYVVCDFQVMDERVKSGEIDMLISFYIPERLPYMIFTEPLMEFKQVIVARTDAQFMSGIGSLRGRRIATVKGVKLYDKLLSPYPDIEMFQVGTMDEMFRAVSEFKADALISKTFYAGYAMQNYPNLKIAGIADLPPEPYFYAVRKDYPELVGILNNAIKSIPKDRLDAIVQKWFSVRIEYRPNWSEILKWAFVVSGVFTIILGLSLFWNRRLKREIDKRMQTEVDLRAGERKYRILTENMKDVVWILDTRTLRFLYVSPSVQKLRGFTPEEIIAEPLDAALTPERADYLKGLIRQRVEEFHAGNDLSDRFYINEVEQPCKDGTTVWTEVVTKYYLNEKSGHLEIQGVTRDITERKRMDAALRESEERHRILFMDSPDAYLIIMDGVFVDCNRATETMLRGDRAQIIGQHPESFSPEIQPDGRKSSEAAEEKIKGALQTGTNTFEWVHRRLDGSDFFVEVSIASIMLDGKPALFTTWRDITRRKQTEENLQKSQEQLRDAHRLAHIGVWSWIAETDTVIWTEELFRIAGLDPGNPAPTYAEQSKLYAPESWDRLKAAVERAIETGASYQLELELIRPEGGIRTVNAFGSATYDNHGRVTGLHGTLQDITERKQAETENAKLEAQNRQLQKAESLGRMAGAIAHNFNNMLQAVIGNLQLADMKLHKGAQPDEHLDGAIKAANKAAEMSRLMLTYLGHTYTIYELLYLSDVCRNILPLLYAGMPKDIVMETDLPIPGPVVSSNESQIQQILTHLISNARESIGDGRGAIGLAVKTVSPADMPVLNRFPTDWKPEEDAYACLEVTDTGCGIKSTDIENIFDPFFTTRFIGRGLGLSVVLGIVRAHGGVITVKSNPEQGSVFSIFLPVSAQKIQDGTD